MDERQRNKNAFGGNSFTRMRKAEENMSTGYARQEYLHDQLCVHEALIRLESVIGGFDPELLYELEPVNLLEERIRTIPVLKKGEEAALVARAAMGDRAAKEKLVEANLVYAADTARERARGNIFEEDLLMEGILAILQTAENFDWSSHTLFSPYAQQAIREVVSLTLARENFAVSVEDGMIVEIFRKIRQKGENGLDARTLEKMAGELGLSVDELMIVLNNRKRYTLSLDSDNGEILRQTLADDQAMDPESFAIRE